MPSSSSSPAEPSDLTSLLGPELSSAFAKKGYTTLTPVQKSVLDPALAGRDLRISSQTGSGKTLAIGLALRDAVLAERPAADTRPRALVIVPTRELATQVHEELSWLYAPVQLRLAVVTGGANYRDEHRMLSRAPGIIVGTPGRLLDHLNRGVIDASALSSVVLDEADRMLDLGFREELEAILGMAPAGHRTHLVSATFARDVIALADRVQKNPIRVEGTPLGSANTDIDHVIYLVAPRDRMAALINVLLYHPEEQTLVFARTRADVADITRELQIAGFAAGALSGEMEQAARVRAMAAFKRGELRALVATDVAARGIDVQDIARVVQMDPPSNPDTYTHRSGRTGRAGRKGTSALLVPPAALRRTQAILQHAKVRFRTDQLPTAAAIRAAQDQRWIAELTADSEGEVPPRIREQVARITEAGLTERALVTLLSRAHKAVGEPRDFGGVPAGSAGARRERERPAQAHESRGSVPPSARGPREWVSFRVTWGEEHGADARRMVAMLCRRGNVRGTDIGAIRVGRATSSVDVASDVAATFAEATSVPDPRDPRVTIAPAQPGGEEERPRRPQAPQDERPRRPHTQQHEERPRRPHAAPPAPEEERPRRPHVAPPAAAAPEERPRRPHVAPPAAAAAEERPRRPSATKHEKPAAPERRERRAPHPAAAKAEAGSRPRREAVEAKRPSTDRTVLHARRRHVIPGGLTPRATATSGGHTPPRRFAKKK